MVKYFHLASLQRA